MNHVSNHFKYTSNVWLTSAILTPCIFGFIMTLFSDDAMEMPMVIILAIPFGMLFSIPNYLIFLFLIWKINTAQLSKIEKKIIINIIGVILTFALFMLIFHRPNRVEEEGFYLALGYSATLTFGIWYFNLDRGNTQSILGKKQLPKIKMLEDILDDEVY
ncbi:MAG: hypothetical protein AB8H03_02175 [Saprospiraceae bacterium]